MEETLNFTDELHKLLDQKVEWYNTEELQTLLGHYRLLYTCVKNINDILIKKSLINADPYKLDRRISDIEVPKVTPFPESETPTILGERLSEFETMLDFICTYFHFSVDNIPLAKIKPLLDLNKVFDWENVTANHSQSNTRSLAMVINQSRVNATAVLISNVTDSLEKCSSSIKEINKILAGYADFQKELYKGKVRLEVIENSEFDKEKAFSSPDNELAEIKRLYVKCTGRKNFYNDLISEVIQEDQAPNKDELRSRVLAKLQPKQKVVKEVAKTAVDTKEMIMQSVVALGGLAPVITQLTQKLSDNFDLLFSKKKSLFNTIKEALRKALGIKEKERIVTIPVVDSKTGAKSYQKVIVNEFLADLGKKRRIYGAFAARGPEFEKIQNAEEEMILTFVNKHVSENQQIFTLVNALDDYFKSNVEILLRPKVKGLKIDLSSYRNLIIGINKKRGEYTSYKEETQQMKNLGI